MKWVWRILKGLGAFIGGVLLVLVGLVVAMWIADPTVPRNVFFGQPITQPAAVERSQPQELVRGAPRENIPIAPPDTLDPRALQELEQAAAATQSVALLVWHRGALRYEKYWPGFTASTRTNPNSMHKSVLALLVGATIADGVIPSVDEPVSRWITEWQGDARRDITVRELLQMSSGLEIPVFGTWKSAKILFGSDLAGGVLSLQAEKPHGSEFQYSNANSQLLVLMLERAVGERYAPYLSRRLWQPLGASDAGLWMDRAGGLPRGFCCLFATARDWLRVGRLILEGGRVDGQAIVPETWIAQMTRASPNNPNFGFQIWRGSPAGTERKYNDFTVKAFHSEPFVAEDILYIDGFGGQRVYIVPSEELIIVRTGVSQTDWDDARLPNILVRALRAHRGTP